VLSEENIRKKCFGVSARVCECVRVKEKWGVGRKRWWSCSAFRFLFSLFHLFFFTSYPSQTVKRGVMGRLMVRLNDGGETAISVEAFEPSNFKKKKSGQTSASGQEGLMGKEKRSHRQFHPPTAVLATNKNRHHKSIPGRSAHYGGSFWELVGSWATFTRVAHRVSDKRIWH